MNINHRSSLLIFAALLSLNAISADQSLELLKSGNKRFVEHHLRADGTAHSDILRLSKGQTPYAIILSCSDSRVAPELVLDQKLGDIFTIRTVGEDLDLTEIASIEYAVKNLGTKLVVVMGHTSCGAVTAAVETPKGTSAGSPSLDVMVKNLQKRIGDFDPKKLSYHLRDESLRNAKAVKSDLISRSEIINKAVASGQVKIIHSLYDIDTGKVEWISENQARKMAAPPGIEPGTDL